MTSQALQSNQTTAAAQNTPPPLQAVCMFCGRPLQAFVIDNGLDIRNQLRVDPCKRCLHRYRFGLSLDGGPAYCTNHGVCIECPSAIDGAQVGDGSELALHTCNREKAEYPPLIPEA